MSPVELRQIDPARHRFRTYRLAECITLFGEPCLVIEWGRLGGRARLRSETFADARSLVKRRDELLARRRRHGYVFISHLEPYSSLQYNPPLCPW